LAESLRIEARCDGNAASIAQEQFDGLSGGRGCGYGIGEDGDGKESGSGGVGGETVRGGGLRGRYAVEAFSEGKDGDAASFAEFGLGQAAAAEIVEEGVPAEVEDVAPRHGVISRTGLRAPAGK
jgi:hypothetical protein